MATIHPSRMGLVPQEPKQDYQRDRQRGRSPSPRSSRRSLSRDRGGYRDEEDSRNNRNGADREVDRRKYRARADDYFEGGRRGDNRPRERSRSVDKQRDKERDARHTSARDRRPSPEYSEYRRLSPPYEHREEHGSTAAPWRKQENMYPTRRGGPLANGYEGGGSDFMNRYVTHINFALCYLTVSRAVEDIRESKVLSMFGHRRLRLLPDRTCSLGVVTAQSYCYFQLIKSRRTATQKV